jgi:hypothetical protein
MKKVAIGCLVVLVILLVGGGIAGYWAYARFVRPITQFAANVKQVGELEKEVTNRSEFVPPSNGELTAASVARFVRVQQHMQDKLGQRMDELKTTYDRLDKSLKAEKREASISEVFGAVRDLATLLVDAKRAQVEALNQNGFSVREYEWVRARVLVAAGVPAAGFDLKKLADQAQAGRVTSLPAVDREALPEAPARNRELVAPYEKQIQDWAPLAYFGF